MFCFQVIKNPLIMDGISSKLSKSKIKEPHIGKFTQIIHLHIDFFQSLILDLVSLIHEKTLLIRDIN